MQLRAPPLARGLHHPSPYATSCSGKKMNAHQRNSRRMRRRARRLKAIRKSALILAWTTAIIALPFAAQSIEKRHPKHQNMTPAQQLARVTTTPAVLSRFQPVPQAGRPLYPYSVIPGGVESAQELASAVEHDPVVANHYADFDLAKTHVVRLSEDHAFYVSYRLGDQVYWTNKKLTVHKGETVVTDGTHEARTRCGNRLSETQSKPTSPKQPTAEEMEVERTPDLVAMEGPWPDFSRMPFLPGGTTEGSQVSEGSGSGGSGTHGFFIPSTSLPYSGTSRTPSSSTPPTSPGTPGTPVSTPEPGTFALLTLGLASAAFLFVLRKGRA